jgi:hypothetical protein
LPCGAGWSIRCTRAKRIEEAALAARLRLHDLEGDDDAASTRCWQDSRDEASCVSRAEQIAWQTHALIARRAGRRWWWRAPHARPGRLEVFVYSPDRDGLFATVVPRWTGWASRSWRRAWSIRADGISSRHVPGAGCRHASSSIRSGAPQREAKLREGPAPTGAACAGAPRAAAPAAPFPHPGQHRLHAAPPNTVPR